MFTHLSVVRFDWRDALNLEHHLTEEEMMVRDQFHAYCQEKLIIVLLIFQPSDLTGGMPWTWNITWPRMRWWYGTSSTRTVRRNSCPGCSWPTDWKVSKWMILCCFGMSSSFMIHLLYHLLAFKVIRHNEIRVMYVFLVYLSIGSGSVILLRPKMGLVPQNMTSLACQQYTNTEHIPMERYHPVVSIMLSYMNLKKHSVKNCVVVKWKSTKFLVWLTVLFSQMRQPSVMIPTISGVSEWSIFPS